MNNDRQTSSGHSEPASTTFSTDSKDRIAQSAHNGIDAASRAAQPAIDRVAAGAHKAIDSADEFIKPAAEALDKAGIKGEELLTAGAGYMRNHPLISLGLAVTAGYLLSNLLASGRQGSARH